MSEKDKRKDILRAALELIVEQGFHGAPMDNIAERAGVGTGTIYRYFKNRDELISILYKDTYERLNEFLIEGYPFNNSIRERFFHLTRRLILYYKNKPLECCYTEQFLSSPYRMADRKENIVNMIGDYDFIRSFFEEGKEHQLIINVPVTMCLILSFAPIVLTVRDHHSGFVTLDDTMSETIVNMCWDCIKM
jgi:AcrR family transcriptional regulator